MAALDHRRVAWRLLPLVLAVFLLVVPLALIAIDLKGGVRFGDAPLLTGEIARLPVGATQRAAGTSKVPPLIGAPPPDAPPLDPDPGLLETHDGMILPRLGGDGAPAYLAFARQDTARAAGGGPVIAVVVTDLALDTDLATRVVTLPDEIGLAVSAYADETAAWQRYARHHGHESLLMLPVALPPDQAGDAGPLALSPLVPPQALRPALQRVLAQGRGYVALAAGAGAFEGAVEAFGPIAAELAARGVAFIELGGDLLAPLAAATGLVYLSAIGPIDADPTPAAIDTRLLRAERAAIEGGSAVVFLRPFETSFDRLWRWCAKLDAKGITLVPVSRLLAASAEVEHG